MANSDGPAKIAAASLKLAVEILFPARARAVNAAVDFVKEAFTENVGRREQKAVMRFIEDLQDGLQSRIEIVDSDFRSLAEGERTQAYEAVQLVLEERPVTYAQLAASNFDPALIADKSVWLLNRELSGRSLSDAAIRLAHNALRLASSDLAAILRSVPGRDSELILETFLEASKNEERVFHALQTSLVPRLRAGEDEELREFTYRYLNSLLSTYGTLEQFGLRNVPAAFRWQPLDLTYISVSATKPLGPAHLRQSAYLDNTNQADKSSMPVERSISSALAAARQAYSESEISAGATQSRGLRLIIKGKAGSGKTTIARWLAVGCAQSVANETPLPGDLKSLSGHIPFIVNLRAGVPGSSVGAFDPTDLLRQVAFRNSAPGNWIHKLLDASRLLLILDGLDELPQAKRSSLVSWILQFNNRYPDVHVVVTSRPEGVDPAAFGRLNFSELSLTALTEPQIVRCANLWYKSAIAGATGDSATRMRRASKRLVTDVKKNLVLRDMLDTPLLVALVCAYYAAGITAAPVSRSGLIREVSSVLVHNRDEERGTLPEELSQFAVEHKFELLGIVAMAMFKRNASTIALGGLGTVLGTADNDGPSIEDLLGDAQADLQISGSRGQVSPALLRYLSERSVVFSRVSAYEAEFVHRSFLEYFAALNLANRADGASQLLSLRAAIGWVNVASFFTAIAPKYAAEWLIGQLLADPSYTKSDDNREMTYALLECAGNLLFISEGLWESLEEVAMTVIPPSSDIEVALISGLGPNALHLLGAPKTLEHARATVETLARIGGRDAIYILSQIAKGPFGSQIAQTFIDAWSRFPKQPQYLRDVILKIDIGDTTVTVDSEWQLFGLTQVTSLRRLVLNVPMSESLAKTLPLYAGLTDLDASGVRDLELRHLVSSAQSLKRLALPISLRDTTLDSLASFSNLRELWIPDASRLKSLDGISELHDLRSLTLGQAERSALDSLITGFEDLRYLKLENCQSSDVDFLSNAELESLLIVDPRGLQSLAALSGLTSLQRLRLSASRTNVEVPLPAGGRLRELYVENLDLADLRELGQHLGLRRCELSGANRRLASLRPFEGMSTLRQLSISGSVGLSALTGIQSLSALKTLSIVNCPNLRDLAFGDDPNQEADGPLPEIEHLTLDGCENLVSLTPLLKMTSLVSLSVLDIFNEALVAPLLDADDFQVEILHEDWWFNPANQMSG